MVLEGQQDHDPVADRGQAVAQYFSPDPLVSTLGLRLLDGRDFLPSEVIESIVNSVTVPVLQDA